MLDHNNIYHVISYSNRSPNQVNVKYLLVKRVLISKARFNTLPGWKRHDKKAKIFVDKPLNDQVVYRKKKIRKFDLNMNANDTSDLPGIYCTSLISVNMLHMLSK